MKKTFRAMVLGASALAFVTAPAVSTSVFAQDAAAAQCTSPEKDKLYNDQFLTNYKGDDQKKRVALTAAEQYLQQYSNCEDNKDVVTYLQNWVGKTKTGLRKQELYARFNKAVQDKNTAEVFAAGKEILVDEPDRVAAMLFMVDSGYSSAQKKVDTFNADTVNHAKLVIEKVNAGKTPQNNSYAPFKDKDEAMAWMNYTIGYITANRLNQKNEAAPYLYKAVGFNSNLKNWYYPYLVIGDMYLNEYTKAAEEYNNKKDATDIDDAKKNELAGMWKAYADRAAEFHARAYNLARADAKTDPNVTKGIYETLTQIYKLRHNNETTGMDAFVASFNGKPVTDPSTAVTPVIEATPATTAATSGTASISSSSASADASSASRTTAANGTGVGAANGTGVGAANGTGVGNGSATTAKPAAKKVVPRKNP